MLVLRLSVGLLLLFLIFPAQLSVAAGKSSGLAAQSLPTDSLIVASGKQRHAFVVEVARQAHEQSRGLMFREHLEDDRGMLFPFKRSRKASFWMKNTLIPLDILFVASDGRIARIAHMTTPLSEESYKSRQSVKGVLELRGGLCKELGIKKGDRVLHAHFGS